ncbi:MAG: hypothetical protein Q8888_01140 [Vigna little leaf phytoplasma]|nr:hypothetical protein [Vigna little leaf phytoplasma]
MLKKIQKGLFYFIILNLFVLTFVSMHFRKENMILANRTDNDKISYSSVSDQDIQQLAIRTVDHVGNNLAKIFTDQEQKDIFKLIQKIFVDALKGDFQISQKSDLSPSTDLNKDNKVELSELSDIYNQVMILISNANDQCMSLTPSLRDEIDLFYRNSFGIASILVLKSRNIN